jgi:HSP20 family protein
MRRFSEDMDRLFDDFGFGGSWFGSSYGRDFFPISLGEFRQSLWTPQMETFEREGQLVIRADLPGLKKEDLNVEITDDAITISGERRDEMKRSAKATIDQSAHTVVSSAASRCRKA